MYQGTFIGDILWYDLKIKSVTNELAKEQMEGQTNVKSEIVSYMNW